MKKTVSILGMRKRVSILGKRAIPLWLLVIALVCAGAGAAAGTVLAGKVTGEVPVAVSQALLCGAPIWTDNMTHDANAPQQVRNHDDWVSLPNRSFGGVADDNTGFQAAAEVAVGDWVAFDLPLKNASKVDLVGLLTLNVPDGLEVEVFAKTSSNDVTEVVRVGPNSWKFKLEGETEYTDFLTFVISADDWIAPGYYYITGIIKQIAY